MEEFHASATSMAVPLLDDNVSEMDRGEEAGGRRGSSIMKADDLAHKLEEHRWDMESPERTPSLLPPFGSVQPAHLPTPLSPGDLVNYLPGLGGSPLSVEHPRSSHSRYLSSQRPPSRPTSTQSPQTPQRGRPSSAFNNPPFLSARKELGDTSRPEEMKSARLAHSQVATPSPEISRTRQTSIPNTPSHSETMLATPQPGIRSFSHLYTQAPSLAPAPIISPANPIDSIMHNAPLEFRHDDSLQPSQTPDFTYDLAALVPEHSNQAAVRAQGSYDIDDPFFVCEGGEGHRDALSRKRYPSPPHPKQLHATHTTTSPLQNAKSKEGSPIENPSAEHILSSSVYSPSQPQSSPVKAEIDDGYYNIPVVAFSAPNNTINDSGTSSQAPISPHTPPRAGSGRASVSDPHVSTLEDSTFRTLPPLSGGEIERIRQRQAVLDETRLTQSEKRRPDYLMRIKRSHDFTDEKAAEGEQESVAPGLGVVISPQRGRRLKLYQPVAVAGNVEDPTEADEAPERKTPPPISTMPTSSISSRLAMIPSMSMRAIDWHSPRRGRSSPVAWTEEDECRKQKRLQAFAAPHPSGKGRRLKPAEVVGQGRVIVDITSEESRILAEDGVLQLLDTPAMDSVEHAELSLATGHGAEWPDKEYPWSVQERQRDDYEEAWRRQRLAWIERFLDRESESEEEENECVAGPSTWNRTFDSGLITQPERELEKSTNASPNSKRSGSLHQVTFSAANTDAREVLLSKRHVREVVERLHKRRIAEEEEGVVMCICQGADDGRPMVRCDECRTWYHLICMDIHDESELGDEWYCWKCLPSAEDPPPPPSTEPTFAPAMPESPPRAGVGDQPLYQSALQPSPMPPSPITQRKGDRSPTRRSRLPHSLGDPGDPVRGGPSTPYHSRSTDSRLYSPPKFYDEYGIDDQAPFDPTSTPSRGLKFPNPVPITPRRPPPWTPVPPLSWTMPSALPQTPQFSAHSGSSTRSLAYSLSTLEDSAGPLTSPWPSDDSPTRKPHKGADSTWSYPNSRRALDSPLPVPGTDHRPFFTGIDDSPTPRHFFRAKDSSELASLVDRSPRRE